MFNIQPHPPTENAVTGGAASCAGLAPERHRVLRVRCPECGDHFGHVVPDRPRAITGPRCIDGIVLRFTPEDG